MQEIVQKSKQLADLTVYFLRGTNKYSHLCKYVKDTNKKILQ